MANPSSPPSPPSLWGLLRSSLQASPMPLGLCLPPREVVGTGYVYYYHWRRRWSCLPARDLLAPLTVSCSGLSCQQSVSLSGICRLAGVKYWASLSLALFSVSFSLSPSLSVSSSALLFLFLSGSGHPSVILTTLTPEGLLQCKRSCSF